jgi:hypothetical protein
VCTDRNEDFLKIAEMLGKKKAATGGTAAAAAAGAGATAVPGHYRWQGEDLKCPLDRKAVGRSTWDFLHTMAVQYPEHPSRKQQKDMFDFLHLVAEFYPWCDTCVVLRVKPIVSCCVENSRTNLMRRVTLLSRVMLCCHTVDIAPTA